MVLSKADPLIYWVQTVKNPSAMRKNWVQSQGWEDPLEKETATHCSILAWRIPWTEGPGMDRGVHGLPRVRHDCTHFTHSVSDTFAPQRTLLSVWRYFWLSQLRGFYWHLVAGMLLDVLRCTGQIHNKTYQNSNVNSAEAEKACCCCYCC